MVPGDWGKVIDKWKPHYSLEKLKELVRNGRYIITKSASQDAFRLGLSEHEILEVVLSLKMDDFYKSMTSYRNHKLWQDVYKPRVYIQDEEMELYIKLQKSTDSKCVIISFKKSEESDV